MCINLCLIIFNFKILQFVAARVEENHTKGEIENDTTPCYSRTNFGTLGDYGVCEENWKEYSDPNGWYNFPSRKYNLSNGFYNFKFTSWNVHSLSECVRKGFKEYLKYENSDIYCIQQTRCSDNCLPLESMVEGYYRYHHGGKNYSNSGIALYSKVEPKRISYGLGVEDFDEEGRLLIAEYPSFFVACVSVISAGPDLIYIAKRVRFDIELKVKLKSLDSKKPVFVGGDMNVAHFDIDLFDPIHHGREPGVSYMERSGFSQLLELGFADTFRQLYPFKLNSFTSWSNLENSRAKNHGRRVDYILVSERLLANVCDHAIRKDIYGSDHCPITIFAGFEYRM